MIGWLPRRTLPVLMYHRLGRPGEGDDPALWIGTGRFEEHLEAIRRRGLESLSLDRAWAAFAGRDPRRRGVLITFDDAFAETLDAALPLLDRHGLRATVFAPAGLLGERATLCRAGAPQRSAGRIATAEELRRWLAAGHDVGSHSLTHADLTALPAAEKEAETARSRTLLEELLDHPVPDFCYPFARHDAASRRAVAAAGYRAAYAGEPPRPGLYSLPRMMVYPDDPPRRLALKLSGHYYWVSAWHRRLTGRGGGRVRPP